MQLNHIIIINFEIIWIFILLNYLNDKNYDEILDHFDSRSIKLIGNNKINVKVI